MSLNVVSSFNGVTDPDAGAYIAAVEAADGLPLEFAVGKAINDFVVGCKADGIWDAIKASCILAGARTFAGALIPLKGTAPNKFGTEGNWNYNRKDGLQGDGSTNYLDSNRNNNADPQNSKHLAIYVSSLGAATTQFLIAGGAYLTVGNSGIFRDAGTYRGRVNVAANQSAAVINSTVLTVPALVGVNRSAADFQSIRAGSTTASNAFASTAPANISTTIFAGPSTDRIFSTAQLAFYSIGESIDLALLRTRVDSLITTIGAAIP